eukprot:jgi/Botrbrau1/14939/Bobra.0018s0043.1
MMQAKEALRVTEERLEQLGMAASEIGAAVALATDAENLRSQAANLAARAQELHVTCSSKTEDAVDAASRAEKAEGEAKVLRGFGDHVAAASASMKMLMWRKRSGDAAKTAQQACEQAEELAEQARLLNDKVLQTEEASNKRKEAALLLETAAQAASAAAALQFQAHEAAAQALRAREAAEAQKQEAKVAECRADGAAAEARSLKRKGRLAEAAEMALSADKWRQAAEDRVAMSRRMAEEAYAKEQEGMEAHRFAGSAEDEVELLSTASDLNQEAAKTNAVLHDLRLKALAARKEAEELVEDAGQKAAEAEEAAAHVAEVSAELSAAQALGDSVACSRAGQALRRWKSWHERAAEAALTANIRAEEATVVAEAAAHEWKQAESASHKLARTCKQIHEAAIVAAAARYATPSKLCLTHYNDCAALKLSAFGTFSF